MLHYYVSIIMTMPTTLGHMGAGVSMPRLHISFNENSGYKLILVRHYIGKLPHIICHYAIKCTYNLNLHCCVEVFEWVFPAEFHCCSPYNQHSQHRIYKVHFSDKSEIYHLKAA